MNRSLLTPALGGLALLIAVPATAHDFFLVPETFVGKRGQALIVHATSSSDFPQLNVGSPRKRIAEVRATVAGRPATVAVQEQPKSLRLAISSNLTGMGVVALQTIWGETDWKPDMVDTYLDEHPFKAEEVATVRRLLPKGSTLQIRSRRLAKSLVCVASCNSPAPAALGLEVEFVPQFDAGRSSPSKVQLLRNGRPLAAHPVAISVGQGKPQTVVTDGNGWMRIPSATRGPVMLVAATLDPPTEKGGRFISNNASLTFEAQQ